MFTKGTKISNPALTAKMNKSIGVLVGTVLKIALSDFRMASALLASLKYQKKAASLRSLHEKKGLHVPPFMIASIVRACNLKCTGCYDKAKQDDASGSDKASCSPPELDSSSWARIFGEARSLGVSFILLAGGEPLLKEQVIRECVNFPEIIFPLFTNALLINESWLEYFESARNVIPIISIEGDEVQTDTRRGEGVHSKVMANVARLQKGKIMYGASITVNAANFETVFSESYIRVLVEGGARVFFFVEYVPFDASTEYLVVTKDQKKALPGKLGMLRTRFRSLFLDFPGDEAAFGGCLASGRGFVHINASGGVESCPFAPYSDTGLATLSLSHALASPLLSRIRALQEELGHNGGCTLFENKEKVEALLTSL